MWCASRQTGGAYRVSKHTKRNARAMIAVEGVEQSEMIRYKLPQAARTSLWPPDEEEPPVLVVVMTPFHHVDHIEFFTSLLPLCLHWVGRDAAQEATARKAYTDPRYPVHHWP